MRPLRLRLSNFLSYRGMTELDLRQVHVACLCGDNGHGKSALLDAITWTLWGWARGRRYGQGGSSHDELVHQGQTEMEVELEFEADGAAYRVVRKYSRGARGRSSASLLDLQTPRVEAAPPGEPATAASDPPVQPSLDGVLESAGAEEQRYRSLTGGAVAETEHQLRRLLRMDYETFVSSAFLLQGHDDRFTTSTPARRKETLAEILGLGLYERLEERAKERVRRHDALLERTRVDLERLDAEAARGAEHRAALAAAEAALQEVAPRLEALDRELQDARRAAHALELRQQEVDGLREGVERGREEARRLVAQIDAARTRTAGYREALSRRAEAEEGEARLAEARERLHGLEEAQGRHAELTEAHLTLRHAMASARQGLEAEVSGLRERVEGELAPRAGRTAEVERSLEAAARGLADLEGEAAQARARREALEGMVREAELTGSENARLRLEMGELRERFDMLVPGETSCPLCGSDLGAEGLEHVRLETEAQGVRLREQYRDNEARLREAAPEHDRLREAVALAEERVEGGRGRLLAEQGALTRELEECRRAGVDLAAARERLSAMQDRLDREDYAPEERLRLADLQRELDALGYEPERHRQARALASDLERFADLARRVREAAERLPQEEASLADLEGVLDSRRGDVVAAESRIAALLDELHEAPSVRQRADDLAAEHRRLDGERVHLQGETVLHAARLLDVARAASEVEERRETERAHQEEGATYRLLAEAFGKRGVQALLIEESQPELENEANSLLARLTENRMHLTLESQKQNRRGEDVETLEVRIADELGTRSYELFSGGEAFRINFALRVALAKLLASRAGAPLRTLFLDEGFGTQDAAGRDRLVDAIRAIQDEFDLILVITHIEELKEAFPVRIEVTKGEEGSALAVVWS